MVSVVEKTSDGKHICPECEEEYEPDFETKEEAKEEGDDADIEQHITGLCSDDCWNAHLGIK